VDRFSPLFEVSTRLERGRFVWPSAKDGVVTLTPAQLSMLFDPPC
jgi:transposase